MPEPTDIVRISKRFRWEMAHRLPYHTAGCQNIHGHSYELWVELLGHPDARGMVMDYGDLKALIAPIIAELDHAFLCSNDDNVMTDFLRNRPFKVVYVDFPTTAENLARYFLDRVKTALGARRTVTGIRIRVAETESTYAEVAASLEAAP